jgi:uncharacterized membrane protein
MKKFFTQPHTLFIFFALLFGIILVFLQPTGAGFDEETHMARIFEMALGHPIPNSYYETAGLPDSFNRVSYRSEKFLPPMDWVKIQRSFEYTVHDPLIVGYRTRATYSPLIYFPQAVGMRILGVMLNLPLPVLYYLFRLSYLLAFTLMGYLSILFIPVGKWVLFILMLAPTTMLQASTITADAITFGVSFLFIGWSLHLVIERVEINKKVFWTTLLLVFLLSSIKINSIPIVLLLLILKPSQFHSTKKQILFWLSIAILLVIVAVGWNVIAWRSDPTVNTSAISLVQNSLKSPLDFIVNFSNYVARNIRPVLSSWIAIYGYGYWSVPVIVHLFFPIALILAILHDLGDKKIPLNVRVILLGLFILLFFGTLALKFMSKRTENGTIAIQGRYFVSVMPFLFLGFTAWGRSLRFSRLLLPIASSLIVLSLGFFLGGMGLSYYKLCGVNVYSGNDCIQPIYKNWNPNDGDIIKLTNKEIIQQSVIFDCDEIDQIRIQILNLDPEFQVGSIEFSLINPENNSIIAKQEYQRDSLSQLGYLSLDFPVYSNIVNKELIFQLNNLSSFDIRLGIPVSNPGEYRGSLSVNGEYKDMDALVQYRCVK